MNTYPITHALVFVIVNVYTKFEVPSFTHSKDMIGTSKI